MYWLGQSDSKLGSALRAKKSDESFCVGMGLMTYRHMPMTIKQNIASAWRGANFLNCPTAFAAALQIKG